MARLFGKKEAMTLLKGPCGCIYAWYWGGALQGFGWCVEDTSECVYDTSSAVDRADFDDSNDIHNADPIVISAGHAMARMGIGR